MGSLEIPLRNALDDHGDGFVYTWVPLASAAGWEPENFGCLLEFVYELLIHVAWKQKALFGNVTSTAGRTLGWQCVGQWCAVDHNTYS
ncbi:MAG: hypothetical protein AAF702_50425 [Chloroflexota bacterium]